MFRSLYIYPLAILAALIAQLGLIKANYLKRKDKIEEYNMTIYRITHWWAKFVIKLSGCKVTVKGLENIPKDKTALFVANHQSNFDIPLLMAVIDTPKGFIAKKELEGIPLLSAWMRRIQCVFMDRKNLRQSAETIVKGINILKSGYSMVVFPEGTRSKGGKHGDFKAGSFKLATKSKSLIVPVTLNGTYKVLEENKNKIKASDLTVIIHKPIDPTVLSKDELANLHEIVQDIVFNPIK
ncbi:1-acyl-sn-glycerol-3-phosphate acyltransferase [Clostridium sp. DSM 8431]|uniref:lysophospholipid acyltransferase family protein n=1 Tax=Clostridium sp. DSM 8431 TaxID=1761781 RepID=UPI0008DF7371|nr:lysophospholipid acyltransferase family protein [Clostridium sp. DSM 8431]SFU85989.1 1-acyl-sn-glycerol-3-phosphate acyltransferase [Clostridium sp. DSM 8431]